MSSPPAKNYLAHYMTEQEYLDSEPYAEVKREYMDGHVYAMAGAKASHNRIVMNMSVALGNHLKGKPCQPYASDMKVRVGSAYFYPDVLVECSGLSDDSVFTDSPSLIVEVLSKSTRRMDETTKRVAYMQIASLQEYVLIEPDFVKVVVMRRAAGWQPEYFYLGDEVSFVSLGLTLPVEALYERVQNEDMLEWLEQKTGEAE